MSQLLIKGHRGTQWRMNATQFRSPMSAQISAAQTRTMLQQFPIRCGQPDIQFTVQFRSLLERRNFANFVRDHQIRARQDANANLVTLWWPERNIENWTGHITSFRVVDKRFDYAPKVTFGVLLCDSMMSTKTTISSWAAPWTSLLGQGIATFADFADDLLRLPNFPRAGDLIPSLSQQNDTGQEPQYIGQQ